jgi:hypothetical protein
VIQISRFNPLLQELPLWFLLGQPQSFLIGMLPFISLGVFGMGLG